VDRAADELFTEPGWVQVMLGQGIMPQRWSPLADAISDADLRDFLTMLEGVYAREVARLPAHNDYLSQFCGPAQTASAAA
jgi:tryptophan 7-halogenase